MRRRTALSLLEAEAILESRPTFTLFCHQCAETWVLEITQEQYTKGKGFADPMTALRIVLDLDASNRIPETLLSSLSQFVKTHENHKVTGAFSKGLANDLDLS